MRAPRKTLRRSKLKSSAGSSLASRSTLSPLPRPSHWRRICNASSAVAMWYAPGDLYLEPGGVPHVNGVDAEGLGVRLLPHTEVTGISAGQLASTG